jgi:hypothetical protein
MIRLLFVVLFWLLWMPLTQAGVLSDRIQSFPNWQTKPPVERATGDLFYPNWIEGTWTVKSTLLDMVAPLAPKVVTPGFESNREYINKPIEFEVRFTKTPKAVIADRAFNGIHIARAYLGDRQVLSVRVDPNSPNKQITLLRDEQQLISTISDRATETRDRNHFITSEVFQQVFRGIGRIYLNQVETTTAYNYLLGKMPAIVADQMTAIYLSPQDPDYFAARESPVALYRYRLEFFPKVKEDKLASRQDVTR